MKRRQFFQAAGVGSAALAALSTSGRAEAAARTAAQHAHAAIVVIPNEVQIKAGGTVNFIVAGFHQIVVYGNGTRPEDIDTSLTVDVTTPPGAPLINDPNNRVYRGIDPSVFPALSGPPQGPGQPKLHDRVEVVHFPEAGRYLVICSVLPHFEDEMWGWVKVN
jgi:plastocyanin